jgi:hypothetical protein
MFDFRDQEYLKQFRAAKDYALGGGKQWKIKESDDVHDGLVRVAWDEFVQRLKEHTGGNHWFRTFLKKVDEYGRFY